MAACSCPAPDTHLRTLLLSIVSRIFSPAGTSLLGASRGTRGCLLEYLLSGVWRQRRAASWVVAEPRPGVQSPSLPPTSGRTLLLLHTGQGATTPWMHAGCSLPPSAQQSRLLECHLLIVPC